MHFHLNRHTYFILTFFLFSTIHKITPPPPQKKKFGKNEWNFVLYLLWWFWISYYAGHTHHTIHHVIHMNHLCTVHFLCHSNCNLSLFGLFCSVWKCIQVPCGKFLLVLEKYLEMLQKQLLVSEDSWETQLL